jgi:hypothetical protein
MQRQKALAAEESNEVSLKLVDKKVNILRNFHNRMILFKFPLFRTTNFLVILTFIDNPIGNRNRGAMEDRN